MKLSVRLPFIASQFLLLSSAPLLHFWVGGDMRPYAVLTLLLAATTFGLVGWWDPETAVDRRGERTTRGTVAAIGVSIVAGAIVILACASWLREILIQPHDPQRADMLIVVQEGIREFLRGKSPYAMYHVPWSATLPYGPMLWGPYVPLVMLRADVRFVSIVGMLVVPILCIGAAAAAARSRNWWQVLGWILLLAAIATNPDLRRFASIGHTPAYWPLLPLLIGLVAAESWYAAAVVAGLLIAARTTMIAVAPVVAMAVWWRARRQFAGAVALLAGGAALPFLPFAIWDATALRYALYGSYQSVIKGFVWTSTTWVQHTIGVSGWLLAAGWERSIEAVQAAIMIAGYVFSWRAIRSGRSPLPWMVLALFLFSMTTLWPVLYLYFDVLLLLACAAIAEERWLYSRSPVTAVISAIALSATAVVVVAWVTIPRDVAIDVGNPTGRQFLRAGFGGDERVDDRTVAKLAGSHAEVALQSRSTEPATIDLDYLTSPAQDGSALRMTASLNGMPLGAVVLDAGWQRVSLHAASRAWQVGVNRLDLDLSGPGVALDRIGVRRGAR